MPRAAELRLPLLTSGSGSGGFSLLISTLSTSAFGKALRQAEGPLAFTVHRWNGRAPLSQTPEDGGFCLSH